MHLLFLSQCYTHLVVIATETACLRIVYRLYQDPSHLLFYQFVSHEMSGMFHLAKAVVELNHQVSGLLYREQYSTVSILQEHA